MKITIKLLLIGATLASTTIAIISNSKLKEQKIENHKIAQKLESTENNLKYLNLKNKKLSKRVVKEINKIINLNDSVKDLDENLKEDQEKLISKTKIANNLNSKNKKLKQKALKADKLEKEIIAAKKEISTAKQLRVSNIASTIMRKKKNGTLIETINNNKIDAFKTNFQILTNEIANSGKKKISLKIYNSENQSLKFTDELNIEYNNKNMDIVSIIEVERTEIIPGNYDVIVYIDNKKVKTSTMSVN